MSITVYGQNGNAESIVNYSFITASAPRKNMLYVILMLFTGCMIAMQAPLNALLGRRVGMLEAGLINFIVGVSALTLLVLIIGKGNPLKALDAPLWQLCGGLFGALMVCASILAVPRIGALSTILAMILGNLAMGAVIDSYGWFGVPITPFSWQRAIGFGLVLGGLLLIVRH